jgi:hypothetical protein
MTVPYRGTTGAGTYFITVSTWEKQCLLQSERMAQLFMDVLFHCHFHALLTPVSPATLEKAL